MKLRIRFGGQRFVLEVVPRKTASPDVTLGDVREKIQNEFSLNTSTFEVSLNGKDTLQGDDTAMSEFGVVAGDLLYVLVSNQENTVSSGRTFAQPVTEIISDSTEKESTVKQEDTNKEQNKELLVHQLMEMGFKRGEAMEALAMSGSSDIQKVVEILLQHNRAKEHPKNGEQAECSKTSQDQSIKVSGEGCSNSGASSYSFSQHSKSRLVLCREGIPDVLKALYAAAEVLTMHEALCIVIHVLMMETGFCVCHDKKSQLQKQADTEEGHSSKLSGDFQGTLPDDWRSVGFIRFRYEHPSCQGVSCVVTCTTLGPYTLVHGMIECDSDVDVYQCKLTATDFIRVNVPLTATPSSIYFNLHRLSRIVKDCVTLPLLSAMRSLLGLPGLVGFMALPAEVKLTILYNLDVKSILNLSCICKELKVITNDSGLWQYLCLRDFGLSSKESPSWKDEYIRNYKMKKDRDKMTFVIPGQSYIPSFGTGAIPNPLYPPGIIGGNSDLYPDVPFMPGGFQPHIGPGIRPGRLPRPRFDPFGPLPDQDVFRGRGRGRGTSSFPSSFGPRYF